MWKRNEFMDYVGQLKTEGSLGPDTLDRLREHVENFTQTERFEDDFTIIEVGFV